MNSLDKQYQELLQDILENGSDRPDRTGTGTLSVFGRQLRHNMGEGFPLLTTKKMAVKTMMTELKWFLKGDTNIKYLVENGCNIWNGDAYKAYCKIAGSLEEPDYEVHVDDPIENRVRLLTQIEFIDKIKTNNSFAARFGELGPIYGKQWRNWKTFRSDNPNAIKKGSDSVEYIDQIKDLIEGLRTNPYGRRHMVSAWNPGEMPRMALPPCHYGFQCYVNDGKLSLMWNQRSVDTFLGLPFNLASYGTLLLLLCAEIGAEPGELICNLGDVHLYKNHLDQAAEQILRKPYKLPELSLTKIDTLNGEFDWEVLNYECHPRISAPLSN